MHQTKLNEETIEGSQRNRLSWQIRPGLQNSASSLSNQNECHSIERLEILQKHMSRIPLNCCSSNSLDQSGCGEAPQVLEKKTKQPRPTEKNLCTNPYSFLDEMFQRHQVNMVTQLNLWKI